jgi:uncharacterized protein with PhoU and TrkA domain
MTSSHTPAHSPRSLAVRTVVAVLSTMALATTAVVASLGLPEGLVRALGGPLPAVAVIQVNPAEPDRVLVCMGPAIAFSGQDASPVGYGAPSNQISNDQASITPLAETDLQDASSLEGALSDTPPVVVRQNSEAGVLAGVSFQELNNPNVRGLAVVECQEPRSETWLVGGDTTTGRQAVLSLSNPGSVPATVNVEVFGESGPIQAPLGRGILVAPGAQRVLSLAGLAPSESQPVVRVSSAGTGIVATLHTSISRGLEADGLAVVTGQDAPSEIRVIAGLFAPPEEIIGPIRGKEGYTDVGSSLRVLAPTENTSVRITVLRAGQGNITTRLELQAGRVGELSLDELGSGDYSVILESDKPIVAGVRNSVGNDERTDTAWAGSSYGVELETSFVVPPVGEQRLTLVNPGQNTITYSLDGRSAGLAGTAMATRGVTPGSYTLIADGPVFAAVSLRSETLIGHFQVLPTRPGQEPVRVSVR